MNLISVRRFGCVALLATMGGAFGASALSAREVVPAERRNPSWTGLIPACDDPAVIADVQGQFANREDRYWQLGLRIGGVDKIRDIGYRPWGADYIPRRFCVARAAMSDGRFREVSYNIIERAGFVGWTWGVEWCVSGLDREFYFAPRCTMARPGQFR